MDLELATTEDILMELKRRQKHFVFIGEQNTNSQHGEVIYAYQGTSRRKLARLLRFVLERLLHGRSGDCP